MLLACIHKIQLLRHVAGLSISKQNKFDMRGDLNSNTKALKYRYNS
mgnify:CR=1 FL=1